MEYRNLGNTGLQVSAIGFGMWPIGGTHSVGGYGAVDEQAAIQAIQHALELGITLFDTAPAYGNGRGEEILAQALGDRRKDVVIVTKAGIPWNEGSRTFERNSTYQEIVQSAEASLRRLQSDVIDILLIHWPDPKTPFAEPMQALADLQQAGKVRYVGVSNFSIDQLNQCLAHGSLAAQQIGYHMFDRRMEGEMLPFCAQQGIGIMAYGSLAHGLLTGAFTPETKFDALDWRASGKAFGLPIFREGNLAQNVAVVEQLRAIAQAHGKSVAQLAIAWVLRQPAVSVALTGARRAQEIADNAGGTGWTLGETDLAAIEQILTGAAGTTPDA
jgi:aryl-alcohol dehydrogenase-like predicted oxidoreductase